LSKKNRKRIKLVLGAAGLAVFYWYWRKESSPYAHSILGIVVAFEFAIFAGDQIFDVLEERESRIQEEKRKTDEKVIKIISDAIAPPKLTDAQKNQLKMAVSKHAGQAFVVMMRADCSVPTGQYAQEICDALLSCGWVGRTFQTSPVPGFPAFAVRVTGRCTTAEDLNKYRANSDWAAPHDLDTAFRQSGVNTSGALVVTCGGHHGRRTIEVFVGEKCLEAAMSVSWNKAQKKAANTARWAVTMTKVRTRRVLSRTRWQLVTFYGKAGGESIGVVDLLAIRKDHGSPRPGMKRGDALQTLLIQVKGGTSAMPTADDAKRLRAVARRHRAKGTLLAVWKRGKEVKFYCLKGSGWAQADIESVFR
jgi:hypothetical protein